MVEVIQGDREAAAAAHRWMCALPRDQFDLLLAYCEAREETVRTDLQAKLDAALAREAGLREALKQALRIASHDPAR